METKPNQQTPAPEPSAPQTNAPQTPVSPPSSSAPASTGSSSSMTPLVAALVLAALLLAALLAYYYVTYMRPAPEQSTLEVGETTDPQVAALEQTSSSDELNAIEGDLNATTESNLNAEVNNLEQAL